MNFPKISLVTLFIFTSVFSLSAQWEQELIPLDDTIYSLTETVFGEAGLVIPNLARPWSRSELTFMLKKLKGVSLSPSSKKLLSIIEGLNNPESTTEPTILSFRFEPSVTLEYYDHLRLLDLGDTPDAYPTDYTSRDRNEFLEIPFQITCFDSLYMESIFDFYESPLVDLTNDKGFTNLPNKVYDLDMMFPHSAYVNLGSEQWDVSLGRFTGEWGNGRTGNLYFSDNSDYYDQLRVKGYWEKFSFTFILVDLDSRTDDDGYYHQGFSAEKYMIGHRFEFTPLDNLRLSFVEGLIMGGEEFDFTLSFLNPMMLYHNWFTVSMGNSYHSVEADYTIPHFRFYLQLCLDQYQSIAEAAENPDSANEPGAFGILTGYESTHTMDGGFLKTGFEFVYTMPYLYTYGNYYTRPSNAQFYSAANSFNLETPLGYFEGPDCIVFSLYSRYEIPLDWSVDGEIRLTYNGENTIKTPYLFGEYATSDIDNSTPTGTVEREWKIKIKGEKYIGEDWHVGAGLTLLLRDNPEPLLVDEDKTYKGTLNSLEWNSYVSYDF